MSTLLAVAQAVFLMSFIKPLLFAAVLIAWGRIASMLSKDAGYYYLQQQRWNAIYVAAVFVGLGLTLYIPVFWGGWVLGMLIMVGPFIGYVFYRNAQVPAPQRWDLSLARLTGRINAYQRERAQANASLTLLAKDEAPQPVPMGDDPNIAAHDLLAEALEFALPRGADRIDIAASTKQAVVTVQIDGAGYPLSQPEPQVAVQLIDYIKSTAGMDVADRRKMQEGILHVDTERFSKHKLEVKTGGSTRAVKMSLWIDPEALASIEYEKLGLLESQRKALDQVLADTGRVVLIASPLQQGRTTTAYALLQKHDPYIQGVRTLEHDKPFDAEGIDHNEFAPTDGLTVVRDRLAALLRSDPDVMMVSRLPGTEIAKLIARSAEEIRFYLPMVADDTFAALKLWIKLVGSRRLAAESLGAVIAQRLVRKLCPTCRRPYKPDAVALKKLNLPMKVQQLYHASGKVMVKEKAERCPICMGLGYRGRIGVFEVMPLDVHARAYIASGEMDKLRAHLRKNKVLWLQEVGLAKVVAGATDVKEVTRALSAGGNVKPKKSGKEASSSGKPSTDSLSSTKAEAPS